MCDEMHFFPKVLALQTKKMDIEKLGLLYHPKSERDWWKVVLKKWVYYKLVNP